MFIASDSLVVARVGGAMNGRCVVGDGCLLLLLFRLHRRLISIYLSIVPIIIFIFNNEFGCFEEKTW